MPLGELILEFSSQERFLYFTFSFPLYKKIIVFTFSFPLYKKNYLYFWQLPKAVAIICRKCIWKISKNESTDGNLELISLIYQGHLIKGQ